MRISRVLGAAVVLSAGTVAIAGLPASVLRLYSESVYPGLQAVLTPVSNRAPLPLFDVMLVLAIAGAGAATLMAIRRAVKRRTLAPAFRVAAALLIAAAALYLWFLAAWGWNYRKPGVETSLPGFQAESATPARVRRLAELSVARVNELHGAAHAAGFPELHAVPRPLLDSLHEVERRLGRVRPTVPSTPKRPWTTPYMRAVGVSGMLAPLFLETYLNPDLTGPERPYVLAHEWAHLSGWAPEEDASFVGFAAAVQADVPAQYSAWLFLMSESAGRLQPVTRDLVLKPLGDGPRADLRAIAARLQQRVAWLDRASWVAYDRAIKSQGASEGVAGYGRVIELVLGSDVLAARGMTR